MSTDEGQKLGLITKHDHAFFRNCIVFPMYNQKGEVVHFVWP